MKTDLYKIKEAIECDIDNMIECQKLPMSNKTLRYNAKVRKDIESQIRLIGRELEPNTLYIHYNKVAYKIGDAWLNKQGVHYD